MVHLVVGSLKLSCSLKPCMIYYFITSLIAAMGIDAGFEMAPRFPNGALETHNWQSFTKFIKKHYQGDELVNIKPNYIELKVGEYPLLHVEGHKPLRFSSKITGLDDNRAWEYIDTVTRAAQVYLVLASKFGTKPSTSRGFTTGRKVMSSQIL